MQTETSHTVPALNATFATTADSVSQLRQERAEKRAAAVLILSCTSTRTSIRVQSGKAPQGRGVVSYGNGIYGLTDKALAAYERTVIGRIMTDF